MSLRLSQPTFTRQLTAVYPEATGKVNALLTVLGLPSPFAEVHGCFIAGLRSHSMTVVPGIG